MSFTVIVNEHVCSLPLLSRAVQRTVVAPFTKRVPEGGVQVVDAMLQLSDEDTENVTAASQRPGSVDARTFAGHVSTGFSRSCTVTVKLQRLVLPLASVATQVTAVRPMRNRVPEAGEQTSVAPAQLSLTAGENEMRASHRPASAAATWLVGQTIAGGSLSLTVTVNEQVFSLPLLSRAVQRTTVAPLPNRVPEGGAQVVDAMAQLSDEVVENVTRASHRAGSVEVTMLPGHAMTGSSSSITVTLKLQRLVLPLGSVATQVTVFVPMANRVPEGGEHTRVAGPQLSEMAGENETTWSHRPTELFVRIFPGHVITGGSRF